MSNKPLLPINQELVVPLKRAIEHANNVFKRDYPTEEMLWVLTNVDDVTMSLTYKHVIKQGTLSQDNETVFTVTHRNLVQLINSFERAIGYQVTTKPALINCRLTIGVILNQFKI